MITLAQRIEELRTERNLSRAELSKALGLPKNSTEKFETGRQTPTQEQQVKLAAFFDVSLFYLRGESNDRTHQETWMDTEFEDDEPAPLPKRRPTPTHTVSPKQTTGEGSLLEPFLKNKAFQDMIQTAILDVLRSPEGQDILARAVCRELNRKN